MTTTHTLGFPRIGSQRELKFACEAYWRKAINAEDLEQVARTIRAENWQRQLTAGIDWLPVGDFSLYDQVLDASVLFGNLPERFQDLNLNDLDRYFAAARGAKIDGRNLPACEMTKWFDTNYHYLVPEFNERTLFSLHPQKLLNEIAEARALSRKLKVVIPGPLTYLWLGKYPEGDKLDLLPSLLVCYRELVDLLIQQNIEWLQLDEPILALDLPQEWRQAFELCYHRLQSKELKLLVASYFGPLKENLGLLNSLPVAAIHIDIVRGRSDLKTALDLLAPHKILSLGVIEGRNIWINDLNSSLKLLQKSKEKLGERLWIAPSCSLLHVPVDLDNETHIDKEIKTWLAFAQQKLYELTTLKAALDAPSELTKRQLQKNAAALLKRTQSTLIHKPEVAYALQQVEDSFYERHSAYTQRAEIQQEQLNFPAFPTSTIGSFPQTAEIRQARKQFKNGELDEASYREFICGQIQRAITEQEQLGLDVLVHGEAERNDMVEYFGEQLQGYAFTAYGWVQSYGSRCVKPPIIFGDISRPKSMTVDWISYAQSLSEKPVKGMLTGPITMLQWSFVRDDQSREQTALQIALALREEVQELAQANIKVIQVDEPALREGLPLRKADWQEYLTWAVKAFKLATCCVSDSTQIHTHMCYAEFNDIIEAIAALDADVITIETSRSNMELLEAFANFRYPNGIGPGVYDIHSPNIPDEAQVVNLIRRAQSYIPYEQLWVNPDCGLKTRSWEETISALKTMMNATRTLRLELT